jgi:acyl-CoA synthetase (AMP-forming)/AMP-acid ligase II
MATVVRDPASAPPDQARRTPLADLIRSRSLMWGHQPYLDHARHDRRLSYGDVDAAVTSWTTAFDEGKLGPEATVGVSIADPVDFALVFLSVIASGRWAVPLDPGVDPNGVGASVAIDHVVADRPAPAETVWGWTDRHHPGRAHYAAQWPVALSATAAVVGAGSGGVVLSSSGTTGAPKVVALSQEQLLHTARAVAVHHGLSSSDRGFNPLPLFHINAEVVGVLATLVAGSCLVMDDRFHRTGFWTLMDRHKVTWINAVPAIISRLSEPGPDETIPPGIRFIRSASAPLAISTLSRFEARTGIGVLETYGMTEAASQITANPVTGRRKPGSVGVAVGVELRIIPDASMTAGRAPSGVGAVGHIQIRGPSVIRAYVGGAHGDRFDGDGWLRTGDIGHLDGDGFLYLDGRSDDVINRGGEKVFPREVEDAILAHPGVAAACVVAQDDPVFGQVPVAFLVLHDIDDGEDMARARVMLVGVRQLLQSNLVRAKRPRTLRVVTALPVGSTGKVQHRVLRVAAVPFLCELDCP